MNLFYLKKFVLVALGLSLGSYFLALPLSEVLGPWLAYRIVLAGSIYIYISLILGSSSKHSGQLIFRLGLGLGLTLAVLLFLPGLLLLMIGAFCAWIARCMYWHSKFATYVVDGFWTGCCAVISFLAFAATGSFTFLWFVFLLTQAFTVLISPLGQKNDILESIGDESALRFEQSHRTANRALRALELRAE